MARRRFHDRKPRDNFEEVADMARSAYRIGREIKDMINTEHKQFVRSSITEPVGTSQVSFNGTTPVILNNPTQGVVDTSRVGDSIKCQTLTVRWFHELGASLNGFTQPVKFVVWWQEDNTLPMPLTAIYRQMGNTSAVLSLKDYDNRFTTKILYEKIYTVEGNEISGLGNNTRVMQKIIKIDKHTQFDNGDNIIVTGCLRMAWISTTSAALATAFLTVYEAALSFTDD